MHQVFVRVEFDSLTPTSSAAGGASGDQVNGQWADLHVTPRDPLFRDRGECELFEHLKDAAHQELRGARRAVPRPPARPTVRRCRTTTITGQVLLPPDQARVASSHH